MKKRIMVVEDHSIVRLDIVEMLKDSGYEVVAAVADGEKAIELTYSLQPDLILMDIKMPKLGGLKASEIIGKKFNIPIILLTAYSQKEFIEKAKQPNIVGYLVKPVSEARLTPAIEVALSQAEDKNGLREKVDGAKQELKNRKVVEKAKGLLMRYLNVTEETAFQKIRKAGMDKQLELVTVSNRIIAKLETKMDEEVYK